MFHPPSVLQSTHSEKKSACLQHEGAAEHSMTFGPLVVAFYVLHALLTREAIRTSILKGAATLRSGKQ